MSEPIRVMLVDDHAMVRKGVRLFLATQPDLEIVGEASSGEEGLALLAELVPDVVLLDLMLPGIGGVETTRQLKQVSPHTKVVILTSSEAPSTVLPAMTAGASAYVLKDIGPAELGDTLRRVAAGEVVVTSRVATLLVQTLAQPSKTPAPIGTQLTPREHEVLKLVAQGKTNGEIAAVLFLSDKTVKTHVSNILAKLQLADRTQAAVYAWREGLLETP